MKKLHLLHVGLPKTGTSWLWEQLKPKLDLADIKEPNHLLRSANIEKYFQYYENYNVTADFTSTNYQIDRYLIKQLSLKNFVNCSITLRDPISYAESWYYQLYVSQNLDSGETRKAFIEYAYDTQLFEYSKFISRWIKYFPRLKIMFYDDLVGNPEQFLINYGRWCKLTFSIDKNKLHSKVNKSKIKYKLPFTQKHKIAINQEINKLQHLTNRKLDHWLL